MEPLSWSWLPSCSPDVAFYVLMVAGLQLAGWSPCPTEDDPARLCALYDRTDWILVAETPGLSMVDSVPAPAAGSAYLVSVEAVDAADNRSQGEADGCG